MSLGYRIVIVALTSVVLSVPFVAAQSKKGQKAKKVIAHRGASGYLPEHTLASASLAHGFNVDYIEPDIVLTKDSVPILMHDIHLDATTNVEEVFPKRARPDGRWYALDFSVAEIKRLRVHERTKFENGKPYFPNRFPSTLNLMTVPTLQEFIELIQGLNRTRNKKIGIYPEVKAPAFHRKEGRDITLIVHRLTKGLKMPVVIQCFDPAALRRLKRTLKSPHPLVQLIGENDWGEAAVDYDRMRTEDGLREIAGYADGIGPWIPHLVRETKEVPGFRLTELAKRARKHKLFIHPYTVRVDQLPSYVKNVEELLEILYFQVGVDAVFTDFGDRAVHFLAGKQ